MLDRSQIFILLVVVAIFGMIVFAVIEGEKKNAGCYRDLGELGYPRVDVEIFCRKTSIGVCELASSKAMMNHLEKFVNGDTTPFVQQAIEGRNADRAASSAMATGMAVGMSTGMMMSK